VYVELAAASAFLDEEHEEPENVMKNDNNSYRLGRMGNHNIVIAAMPDGEYGTMSSAGVARDMLHSFPNLRIGLMVGIGGGAPSTKHDIRLGDIVVSSPRDGHGGVFQYDFGRTIQDQKFQETRFLDQPPTVLRTAVTNLRAEYDKKGHQIQQAITAVLSSNSKMRKKYGQPAAGLDLLYKADKIHSDDSGDCATVCDDTAVVPRAARQDDDDDPMIHYGLIASGNRLMKNATVRDALVRQKDVLCFEMEAAGLMNHFPCLVIRGICDYSDTHKNDVWQGYAAMVAAAYAKDLLKRILPRKVEAEKRLSELVHAG
jgi:nucleoside phosphorylase